MKYIFTMLAFLFLVGCGDGYSASGACTANTNSDGTTSSSCSS